MIEKKATERQELTHLETHRFLTNIGESRQILADVYRALGFIQDKLENGIPVPQRELENLVDGLAQKLGAKLAPWDRQPVHGGGMELRLINEPHHLLAAGDRTARWLIDSINRTGNVAEVRTIVRETESSLTEIYRRLSGDTANPTMIRDKAR
jgi:hypothetical protein